MRARKVRIENGSYEPPFVMASRKGSRLGKKGPGLGGPGRVYRSSLAVTCANGLDLRQITRRTNARGRPEADPLLR